MSADALLQAALDHLPPKPPDGAKQAEKRRYSELMSNAIAPALAEAMRQRGMKGALPAPPGTTTGSGAERRMAGGIGAKKVDVTWATQESGLLAAITVKTINYRDGRSKNFQKNLTNRRNDLLVEAVTLHRRFPYAVLVGLIWLDAQARHDGTSRRHSTFENAHPRLRLFTGREDAADPDEQYEALYVGLVDANPFNSSWEMYEAGQPTALVSLDQVLTRLVETVATRNPDFYEVDAQGILKEI